MSSSTTSLDSLPGDVHAQIFLSLHARKDRQAFAHASSCIHDAVIPFVSCLTIDASDIEDAVQAVRNYPKGAQLRTLRIRYDPVAAGHTIPRPPCLFHVLDALESSRKSRERCHSITSLDVTGCQAGRWESMACGDILRRLTPHLCTLRIGPHCCVSTNLARQLSLLPQLTSLAYHIGDCPPTKALWDVVKLSQLQHLVLVADEGVLNTWGDVSCVARCQNLRELRLCSHHPAEVVGVERVLHACEHLQVIQLPSMQPLLHESVRSASLQRIELCGMHLPHPLCSAEGFARKFPALKCIVVAELVLCDTLEKMRRI